MRKPCCEKEGINKGAWSKQEDQKLIDYITAHGEGCWRSLPKAAGLHRCGKSCRLRWINYLRPDIKRGNFAHDEEDLIIKLHALLGNRWSLIAGRLPGRTDNEVKNYWNSHIRKKLLRMGIDPNNHKPHQHVPPTTTTTTTTTTTASSRSLNDQNNNDVAADPIMISKPSSDHDQPYGDQDDHDATSHDHRAMVDLNLDLTIAMPCTPSNKRVTAVLLFDNRNDAETTSGVTSSDAAGAPDPSPTTLTLFS